MPALENLEYLIEEYTSQLDNDTADEVYNSAYGFANEELERFVTWLKERNAPDTRTPVDGRLVSMSLGRVCVMLDDKATVYPIKKQYWTNDKGIVVEWDDTVVLEDEVSYANT